MTEPARPKRRITVLALASLLGGCYSEVPLDLMPTIAVDPKLAGDWTCVSPKDKSATGRLKLKAMDRFRYAVSWQAEGDKREKYVAYASSVEGRTLFNLRLDPPQSNRWWDHPWTFMAIDLSSGALQIEMLSDGIVTGKERSPEELRKSFAAALGRSATLTQDMMVCRTKK